MFLDTNGSLVFNMRFKDITEDFEKNSALPSNDSYETVGIMFGRFNPPHRGHAAAWQMASENDHWYVGTNKSTQGKKDPLPFDVKIKAMEALWPGVANHIVAESNLFTLASKVYAEHGKVPLTVYTDESWLTDSLVKYNGKEGKHGYYEFASIHQKPTPRLSSATDVRNAVAANDRDAFTKAAGIDADTIIDGKPYFDLVAHYLLGVNESENDKYNITVNESIDMKNLNELRQLAGLPLSESVDEAAAVPFQVGRSSYYGMSDAEKKLADIGRLLMRNAESEKEPELSNAMAQLGGGLADGSVSDQQSLVDFISSVDSSLQAGLSNQATLAIRAYNDGDRAAGGEESEGEPEDTSDEFDVADDQEIPVQDTEDDMMDSVDFSDIAAEYVSEESDEDCPHCDGTGEHYFSADMDGAPRSYECTKCDGTGKVGGSSGEPSEDDYANDYSEIDETEESVEEEAVEETSQNAIDSAMAELRQLAGL